MGMLWMLWNGEPVHGLGAEIRGDAVMSPYGGNRSSSAGSCVHACRARLQLALI